MNNKINKPIIVAREEFRSNLANLINTSGLPIYVIEPVLNDILSEVVRVSQLQYQKELKQYQEALDNDKDEDTNK